VYVDRNLSQVLGISEGELVSYADIQKRLHKYIKDNDLKNMQKARQAAPLPPSPAAAPTQTEMVAQEVKRSSAGVKKCRDCGSEIPFEAMYCDMCGVTQ
jgi:hypothetical protein